MWLKAISDEVMSFQSVSKSLVQTPSLLGHSNLPPTPIKKKKEKKKKTQMKPSDQNEMFWFQQIYTQGFVLSCLVLTQAWWYQTQSTQQRKDAPISFWKQILITNSSPRPLAIGAHPYYDAGANVKIIEK